MTSITVKNQLTQRSHQGGAVFIVSLVILLIITMLAVGGMQSSLLEEKMAGNVSDRNLIEGIVSLGDFDGSAGLHSRTDIEPSYYSASTWSDSSDHVVADTDFGAYDSPRYFIKHFTTVTGTEGSLNMSGYGDNKGTGDVTIFKITARGTGASAESAEVILRTQYGRIF